MIVILIALMTWVLMDAPHQKRQFETTALGKTAERGTQAEFDIVTTNARASTLYPARRPCGCVAIGASRVGFVPSTTLNCSSLFVFAEMFYASSVLVSKGIPRLAHSRTGRRCHIRQWRFWCRFYQQLVCSPNFALICCICPQPTVNIAQVTRSRWTRPSVQRPSISSGSRSTRLIR